MTRASSLLSVRPTKILHADWSKTAAKRWVCAARVEKNGGYAIAPPTQVGELQTFVRSLAETAPNDHVLAGFDFPIGFPRLYGDLAGVSNFRSWLTTFTEWEKLEPASTLADVSIERPFYPKTGGPKGSVNRAAFSERLFGSGAERKSDPLLRRCDLAGKAACPMFWTLGANQVGRAAVSGWRDVLQPLLAQLGDEVGLWPFDGTLSQLLAARRILIVETYPAEFYARGWLGGSVAGASRRPFVKTDPTHRAGATERLLTWAMARGWRISDPHAVRDAIERGEDDAFDALVGCFALADGVTLPWVEPSSTDTVEGWMFGRIESRTPNVGAEATASMHKSTSRRASPDAVIEAYKRGIDRTLLRDNLKRTVDERLLQLIELQRFAEEMQRAGKQQRARR